MRVKAKADTTHVRKGCLKGAYTWQDVRRKRETGTARAHELGLR